MRLLLVIAFGLIAAPAIGQDFEQVQVQAEIIPSSLTLTVSSPRLSFGQVSQDADDILIDPATGERAGMAMGPHSLASMMITGDPGVAYAIRVTPPTTLTSVVPQGFDPEYTLLWARSTSCEEAGFASVISQQNLEDTLGALGCARIRIGGILTPNKAEPGAYDGVMSVEIVQL